MPRKARKNLIGRFYHIMVQGLNKEYIFEEKCNKERYKKILKEKIDGKNIEIIAYCIMGNHAHMLVYTENIKEMSNLMQKVNTQYAIYYNKLKNRVGFVFRNRYNSEEIKDEKHIKSCIVYIHKNPIKAKIVKDESEYNFSSYNEYMTEVDLISKDMIKIIFGTEDKEKMKKAIYWLHKKTIIGEFKDVSTEIDYHKILKNYKNSNLTDEKIIKRFKEKYKLSERKISETMNITRYKISKILK